MSRITLAAATKLCLCLPVAAQATPEIVGVRSALEVREIRQVVETLDVYLDTVTDLPRAGRPLDRIELVDAGSTLSYHGSQTRIAGTIRGLYDAEAATIYLVRPWFGDTPHDRSVLLHELYHHRQVGARHFYCPEEMELPAYRAQEAYLDALGETLDVNWVRVVLSASCSPRDHHPD